MGKARGVDSKLARLRVLRDEPQSAARLSELRAFLDDKSNFVVAAAAEIAGEQRLNDLSPQLVASFHRFLIDPTESDKICKAKIAIVEALDKIEYDHEDIFRVAIKHVQQEPRWGGSDDTAAPLRAAAAFALVRVHPRDLMHLLVDLLADSEKISRVAAAKALGGVGSTAAIPVLRLKARTGDKEPEVVVECLSALIAADAVESIPFVREFLGAANDEIAEGAALALGESRRPEAFEALKKQWPRAKGESLRGVLLLAIAITRQTAAVDFLLEVLAGNVEADALDALAGLAISRHNPSVRDRVQEIVGRSKCTALRQKFDKDFRVS